MRAGNARRAALAAGLSLLAAAPVRADTVTTLDGGRLEGRVVRRTPSEVEMIVGGERVSIGADKIRSVDYDVAGAAAAPPADGGFPGPHRPANPFGTDADVLSLEFGAADPLSRVRLSGSGGGSAADGEAGLSTGLQYLHYPTPRAGFGLAVRWYDRAAARSSDLLPASDARVYGDTFLVMGAAKFVLSERGWTRPYALLGAGAHWTSMEIDARPRQGAVWADTGTSEQRRLVNDAQWGPAFSASLGLDLGYPNLDVVSIEAGWTVLGGATYRATDAGRAAGVTGTSGPMNFFTLSARLGFRL